MVQHQRYSLLWFLQVPTRKKSTYNSSGQHYIVVFRSNGITHSATRCCQSSNIIPPMHHNIQLLHERTHRIPPLVHNADAKNAWNTTNTNTLKDGYNKYYTALSSWDLQLFGIARKSGCHQTGHNVQSPVKPSNVNSCLAFLVHDR